MQQALRRLLRGRTSIAIAHRLSKIREADLIVAMYNGPIVEQGTHEESMARRGRDSALATARLALTPAVSAEFPTPGSRTPLTPTAAQRTPGPVRRARGW